MSGKRRKLIRITLEQRGALPKNKPYIYHDPVTGEKIEMCGAAARRRKDFICENAPYYWPGPARVTNGRCYHCGGASIGAPITNPKSDSVFLHLLFPEPVELSDDAYTSLRENITADVSRLKAIAQKIRGAEDERKAFKLWQDFEKIEDRLVKKCVAENQWLSDKARNLNEQQANKLKQILILAVLTALDDPRAGLSDQQQNTVRFLIQQSLKQPVREDVGRDDRSIVPASCAD